MSLPLPPGNIGQRLIPSLIDEIAEADPKRVFYSITRTSNPADGFRNITAKQFARAVDRCAWHIKERLGQGEGFPTLTYMGPQDLVYGIIIVASAKAGYKMLLNSPRNTLEAHLHLFEKTDCNIFLHPPDFVLPAVRQILEARPMKEVEIPLLEHWLQDGPHEPYPYNKSFAEARLEPFVVMHTSGSTGLPKAIIMTHGTNSPLDAFASLPSLGLADTFPVLCRGTRVYSAFPLFHSAGVCLLLPASIYAGFTVVLGPFPPSAETANAMHVHANVQHSLIPPTVISDLTKTPEYLENLARLEQIAYGGGPCPASVSELVSTKTRIQNTLGSTESGMHPVERCQDPASMKTSLVLGHEYRHFSGNLYEQVIVRKPELELYQGVFCTFPELQEWPMKDLYSKHPTNEGEWIHRGRADDIVVFSTGEKLNPIDMEDIINENPLVSAALIGGQCRFQSYLLVELSQQPESKEDRARILDTIWDSIKRANQISPSHAKIHRDMILLTTLEKPMLRAGKGTVQRQLTLEMYSSEIDNLYSEHNEQSLRQTEDSKNQSLEKAIKEIVAQSTEINVAALTPENDLFSHGLDSLQVSVIAKKINQLLANKGKFISFDTKIVYRNPSLQALAASVSTILNGEDSSLEAPQSSMQEIFDKFAEDIPISARDAHESAPGSFVFLLTGSTGSLGSYILDGLQRNPEVRHVYILNRGPESLDRQERSLKAKGLHSLTEKVTCLEVDLSLRHLGLEPSTYKELIRNVTHIVHNAWRVNFNLSLESFAGQIAGVRRLIEFSVQSRHAARILFVSSLSTVSGLSGRVPEELYTEWHTPQDMGYARSKFVSELLLDRAARESGIPAVICRVGQIAGPTTSDGIWPKQEWVPSLIASSKYLGKLPDSLGEMEVIEWIPVDILAQGIIELATARTDGVETGARVYHMVNPNQSLWRDVVSTIQKYFEHSGVVIQMASFKDWVTDLRESTSKLEDIDQNPASKLVSFYEGLLENTERGVSLDTKTAVKTSLSMAGLKPVGKEWMANWMQQWSF
jgi:thioester reductase-like protein/acyl-CoA synthetase (AMP-forming)/AMP-acid ligase II/aryl carrier-like protein